MNLFALLALLLLAGILGGAMSFYMEQPAKDLPPQEGAATESAATARPMFPYLVLGVGASFMVPLFLNMISSTLVSEALKSETGADAAGRLLVIAGFALIAAVSSRRFITTLTDRVIQDVQKSKEVATAAKKAATEAVEAAIEAEKKIDLVVEPEGAPKDVDDAAPRHAPMAEDNKALTAHEKRVLETLLNSTYAARALSGIWRDSELQEHEAKMALDALLEKGLVHRTQTFKGFAKWQLTNAGRKAASAA